MNRSFVIPEKLGRWLVVVLFWVLSTFLVLGALLGSDFGVAREEIPVQKDCISLWVKVADIRVMGSEIYTDIAYEYEGEKNIKTMRGFPMVLQGEEIMLSYNPERDMFVNDFPTADDLRESPKFKKLCKIILGTLIMNILLTAGVIIVTVYEKTGQIVLEGVVTDLYVQPPEDKNPALPDWAFKLSFGKTIPPGVTRTYVACKFLSPKSGMDMTIYNLTDLRVYLDIGDTVEIQCNKRHPESSTIKFTEA